MFAFVDVQTTAWGLVGLAVLGPIAIVMFAMRSRQRLVDRLANLEDVLRRMRSSEPSSQFDDSSNENSAQLSRERLMLTNLLDRFPEVTQKFANIETADALGRVMLEAFSRVLDCQYGAVFLVDDQELRVISQQGLDDSEFPSDLTIRMGHGRVGYVAMNCLILRPDDFASLERDVRDHIERTRVFDREFDFYIPLVESRRPIGLVAIGGMRKVVHKAHSVSMALANLGALVISNIQRAAEIRALGETDPLTKLANRRRAYQLLDARLTARNSAPFALSLFDVDHFKDVNDEFGHAVGDEVLVRVADEVAKFVHPSEGEFACRFGGEEFLCVLNCDDVPALAARLEEFRHAISTIRIQPEGAEEPRHVNISGGIAFCPAEHDDADALIKLADDRLYAAKESGRDRIFMEAGVQEPSS